MGRSGKLWSGRTGWNEGPSRIPRGGSCPGIVMILWVLASFAVSVISQNYIRHRQKAKSRVRLAELRQYVVIAE